MAQDDAPHRPMGAVAADQSRIVSLHWVEFFSLALLFAVAGGILLACAVDASGPLRGLWGALLVTVAAGMTSVYTGYRWKYGEPPHPSDGRPRPLALTGLLRFEFVALEVLLVIGGVLVIWCTVDRSVPLLSLWGVLMHLVALWAGISHVIEPTDVDSRANGSPANDSTPDVPTANDPAAETVAGGRTAVRTEPSVDADTQRVWRLVIGGSFALGVIVVVVAALLRSAIGAYVGLALVTIGVGPWVAWLHSGKTDRAVRLTYGGLGLGLVGVVVLAVSLGLDGWGWLRWVAIVVALVAIGAYARGVGALTPRERTTGLLRVFPGPSVRYPIVAAFVGLVALFAGNLYEKPFGILIGGWIIVVSLLAIGAMADDLALSTFSKVAMLVAGLLFCAIGAYTLWTTDAAGNSLSFLFFVVIVVALLGSALVFRGEVVFVAVLVGFAFVWGLVGFTIADESEVSTVADADTGDAATSGVVSFGDSFISGEGAPEFYDRTDQKGGQRNECRRAPTAYSALVAIDENGAVVGEEHGIAAIDGLTNPGLDFYACSGAKLHQMITFEVDSGELTSAELELREQEFATKRERFECDVPDERLDAQYPCGPADVYGYAVQLDNLPVERGDTQLVLVSIGGNDARFGDIVAGCLLPGSCAERREIWLDNVARLSGDLERAYGALRDEFSDSGPNGAAVVVMPYPLVLTEDSCSSSPLDDSEHEFVFEFTTVLNQHIRAAAERAGVHFFEDGIFAFDGHRLCEGQDPAINLIKLQPTDGSLVERINPLNWTHNSMHPNPLGHRLTAQALVAWLNRDGIIAQGNPEPDQSASAELLDIRPTRPFSIEPETVAQLQSGRPSNPDCDFESINTFVTRVDVFDEESEDPNDAATPVPIIGADPEESLCYTNSAGVWQTARRVTEAEAEAPAPETTAEGRRSLVTFDGGQVVLRGGRPGDACRELFPESDPDDESMCDYQWVLYAPPIDAAAVAEDPEAAAANREWVLRAIRYCTTDPDCPDTFDAWKGEQVESASRKVLPPLGVVFFGGWLTALATILLVEQRRRSASAASS